MVDMRDRGLGRGDVEEITWESVTETEGTLVDFGGGAPTASETIN